MIFIKFDNSRKIEYLSNVYLRYKCPYIDKMKFVLSIKKRIVHFFCYKYLTSNFCNLVFELYSFY